MSMDIGQVVEASGIATSTLHVWERHGLITPTHRNGLRRQYGDDILVRLAMIVTGQRAGFTLGEIAQLLDPANDEPAKQFYASKLDELRAQRDQLDAAITSLEHGIQCPHPSASDCPEFMAWLDGVLPVDR